jgi:hypothetical protein
MAKKPGKKSLPDWIGQLTPEQLTRLESLRPIADAPDTCEMATIKLTRVRTGNDENKNGLWLVGNVDKAATTTPPSPPPSPRKRR